MVRVVTIGKFVPRLVLGKREDPVRKKWGIGE
jgi:hypothetical protein